MTKGFIKGVAAVLAAAILAGGVCAAGYASRTDEGWFKESDIAKWHWSDKSPVDEAKVIDENGNVLEAGKAHAMPVAMAFIAPQSETATATSSVTVTCEHQLQYANVSIVWQIVNADGEEVKTSAVTVTPSEEDSSTATVRCNEPFGTTLYLKAYLSDTPSKSATCKLDYVKRLNVSGWGADKNSGWNHEGNLDFGEDIDLFFKCEPGIGSKTADYYEGYVNFILSPAAQTSIQNLLKFNITFKSSKFDAQDDFYIDDLTDVITDSYSTSGNQRLIRYQTSACFDYSDFIEGFEDYDAAHKNAIYYAWYKARNKTFIADYEISFYYNNVLTESISSSNAAPFYSNFPCGSYEYERLGGVTLPSDLVF